METQIRAKQHKLARDETCYRRSAPGPIFFVGCCLLAHSSLLLPTSLFHFHLSLGGTRFGVSGRPSAKWRKSGKPQGLKEPGKPRKKAQIRWKKERGRLPEGKKAATAAAAKWMNVRRCWCCSASQTIDRPSKPTSFRGRQKKEAEKKRRKQQQFFSSSFSSSSNIATLQLQHRTKQTGRQLER